MRPSSPAPSGRRPGTVRDLAGALARAVLGTMPPGARRAALVAGLDEAHGDDRRVLDARAAAEVEATARRWSRHVELTWAAQGDLQPEERSAGWPPVPVEEARAAAQRAHSAELRDDGIAVVRVGGMVGVAADGPVLVACSHAVAGARALVLDLRADGEGDPSTVRLVLDWVESGRGDRERLVSTVRYPDRVRQWWTSGWFPGAPLADGVPVVALVGPGTYSSGEALAHHLRRSGALLVGERTPGAADHVVPVALLPHVSALVPEAEVRDGDGSTWEGVGVEPDVVVPADEALGAAVIAVGRGRQVTRIHRGHGPARGLEIR